MGLKSDIYDAFVKNLGEDNVNATSDSQKKVDELADDISKAIQTFILAQEFKVDKLSAPVFIPVGSVSNIAPIPAPGPPGAGLVPPLTPISLQGKAPGIPFIDSTADVDVNGQTANGSLLGKSASDNSLVKLRVVKKGSE
tara:strand:- start:80 stop:499 length:420 start_codon:yes stop_codon:yes gene_type:complete